MKKNYITPQSTRFAFVEPLAPLCLSKSFGADESGEAASAVWSNRMEMNNQNDGIWGSSVDE